MKPKKRKQKRLNTGKKENKATKAKTARTAKNPINLKKKHFIALFIIAILFSVSITEFVYFFYKVKYITSYDLALGVSESVGFAIGRPGMDFGSVPPGGSATRELVILNNYTIPLFVEAITKGELKEFLYIENSTFTLEPGEYINLPVTAYVPADAEFKEYTGKLTLIFKRV